VPVVKSSFSSLPIFGTVLRHRFPLIPPVGFFFTGASRKTRLQELLLLHALFVAASPLPGVLISFRIVFSGFLFKAKVVLLSVSHRDFLTMTPVRRSSLFRSRPFLRERSPSFFAPPYGPPSFSLFPLSHLPLFTQTTSTPPYNNRLRPLIFWVFFSLIDALPPLSICAGCHSPPPQGQPLSLGLETKRP